jgi:hypothetical protein
MTARHLNQIVTQLHTRYMPSIDGILIESYRNYALNSSSEKV